jgi:hypothetical protein
MSKPQTAPKLKGPMNTLLKLNEEYDLAKQRSHKFSYKSPKELPKRR